MAREANLDARAISEEDTLLFFKRIVAKLHGVNLNKEFTDPKKKQENTVKAMQVEKLPLLRVVGTQKVRGLQCQKEIKAKEKGKGTIALRPLRHHLMAREVSREKVTPKLNLRSSKVRVVNQCQSRAHLRVRHRHLHLQTRQHLSQNLPRENQGRFQGNVHTLHLLEDALEVTNVCIYVKWRQESQNRHYVRM